jgi:hypothetical protein
MKQRGELERLAGAAVIVTGSAAILDLRHSTNSPAIVNVSSLNALAAWAASPTRPRKSGIGALTINLQGGLSPAGTLTGRRSGR